MIALMLILLVLILLVLIALVLIALVLLKSAHSTVAVTDINGANRISADRC